MTAAIVRELREWIYAQLEEHKSFTCANLEWYREQQGLESVEMTVLWHQAHVLVAEGRLSSRKQGGAVVFCTPGSEGRIHRF